ncbi:MAG TPA: bile acid:sodium symporter [Victivallales bacterium]|nr:bile acid:sodium symporter [Victivallales bacterium]
MKNFIKQNLLIIVIASGIALSIAFPELGKYLKSLKISDPIVFLIFLFQGMALNFGKLFENPKVAWTISLGFLLAFALFPLLAFLAIKSGIFLTHEIVGLALICCMTPTIVSGVVMSDRAGGEHTSALVLTVVLSLVGVAIIPLNLMWLLKTLVEVDSKKLFFDLMITVLTPSLVGWALRKNFSSLQKVQNFMKVGQVYLLGFLLFISLSAQSRKLFEINPVRIAIIAAVSLSIHLLVLFLGYALSKKIKNDEATSRSVGIVCSEKSLALGIPVWVGAFAAVHPLSILPPIIFHFSQIFIDGIIANWWSGKK